MRLSAATGGLAFLAALALAGTAAAQGEPDPVPGDEPPPWVEDDAEPAPPPEPPPPVVAAEPAPPLPVAPVAPVAPPGPQPFVGRTVPPRWGPMEDAETIDDPVPRATHLMTRFAAGGTVRNLFGNLMAGGEGELGVGVDSPFGSFSLAASFFGGVTEGGFTTLHGVMGFYAAWPIGIVRVGFQPRIGYIDIDRVTTPSQFGAYTAGLAALVSVDVVRSEGVAFAFGVRPVLDALLPANSDGIGQDSAATLFGGNAFVEVRWRSAE